PGSAACSGREAFGDPVGLRPVGARGQRRSAPAPARPGLALPRLRPEGASHPRLQPVRRDQERRMNTNPWGAAPLWYRIPPAMRPVVASTAVFIGLSALGLLVTLAGIGVAALSDPVGFQR